MSRLKKAAQRERLLKAVRLRAARFTLDQIAKECGFYDASSVRKALNDYYAKEIREPAQQALALELDLLDNMARGLMVAATTGDVRAANVMLKIIDTRAKLTNLYPKPETTSQTEGIRVILDPRMLNQHALTQIPQEVVLEQVGDDRPND